VDHQNREKEINPEKVSLEINESKCAACMNFDLSCEGALLVNK